MKFLEEEQRSVDSADSAAESTKALVFVAAMPMLFLFILNPLIAVVVSIAF